MILAFITQHVTLILCEVQAKDTNGLLFITVFVEFFSNSAIRVKEGTPLVIIVISQVSAMCLNNG